MVFPTVVVVVVVVTAVEVTALGLTVTLVSDWVVAETVVVGEVVPPVRPISSVSSWDCDCNLIQLFTSVWFS